MGSGVAGLTAIPSCARPGSPFRDEITLAILQLQENNRLEILKRKWWEGSRCPKEEDHRAKGQPPSRARSSQRPRGPVPAPPQRPRGPTPTRPMPRLSPPPRSGHGEHWRDFCRAHLWPHHCRLRGGHGIHLVHSEVSRVRGGEETDCGWGSSRGDPPSGGWHLGDGEGV